MLPILEETQLLIDHDLPGAVALCEHLVHLDVFPLHVNVALIETGVLVICCFSFSNGFGCGQCGYIMW